MRSSWLRMGPTSNDRCPHKCQKSRQTHTERKLGEDRGTEAATRVILSQTKEFQEPPDAGRDREDSSLELLEGARPCPHLDF